MIKEDELLYVVDEHNKPIAPKPRKETHANGYWHRTSHVWIVNTKRELLCQKRSLAKDINPGRWEAFFGGHLHPHEGYLEGAIKEVNEELNLDLKKEDLTLVKIHKAERGKEFQAVYYTTWDGDIHTVMYEEEEIDMLAWHDIESVRAKLSAGSDDTWSKPKYADEILAAITNTNSS